jgi:hypothetical protein
MLLHQMFVVRFMVLGSYQTLIRQGYMLVRLLALMLQIILLNFNTNHCYVSCCYRYYYYNFTNIITITCICSFI